MAIRYTTDGSAQVQVTPFGVRVKGLVSRTGIQIYKNADGTIRREYRSPKQVFSPETLESFKGAPVVIGHPKVTPENWDKHAIGSTLSAKKFDGKSPDKHEWTEGDIVINKKSAIEKLGTELVEVSIAYDQDADPTPGFTENGEPYDVLQTNIRVVHTGIWKPGWAIAGRNARLNLDGDEEFEASENVKENVNKGTKMAKMIRYDGVDCESGSDTHISLMQKTIDTQAKQIADGNVALTNVQKEKDRVDGELTGVKAKLTETENKLKVETDPKNREDGIQKELTFRDSVRGILGADYKFVNQDGTSIERKNVLVQAIKKISPDAQLRTDGSLEYVQGVFDTIVASRPKTDYTEGSREDGSFTPSDLTEAKWGAAKKYYGG